MALRKLTARQPPSLDNVAAKALRAREIDRSAFGGRLRGRIDVVVNGKDKRIEDYKTGVVGGLDTNDAYRLQLLLYAALEFENSGVMPTTAALVPLTGEPVEFNIDPAEVTTAVDRVLANLEAYQECVNSGAVETLASPAPANCRWCQFSVHCPAFWESCDVGWALEGIAAVAGTVTAVIRSGDGVPSSLEVESNVGTHLGPTAIQGLSNVSDLPADLIAEGSYVSVAALRVGRTSLRASDQTQVYVAPA
jgi:hypothetical protein